MTNPYPEKFEKIEKLSKMWEVLNQGNFNLACYDNKICICFDDLNQLTEVRKLARKVFPDWKDNFIYAWNGCGSNMLASWEDYKTSDGLLQLWFKCHKDDFPTDILGKGENCKIVESTEVRYDFVCEV